MAGAPTGTVTFLFTDVEGSTAAWEQWPDAMRTALAVHDELLRSTISMHGGHVFSTRGDGFAVAFRGPRHTIRVAVESQAALARASWPDGLALRVRMGIHSGETDERGGDYFGPAVNRAARVTDAANGAQILVSAATPRGPAGRSSAGRALGGPRLPRPSRRHRARPALSRRVPRVRERQSPAAVRQGQRGQPAHRRASALRSIRRRRIDRERAGTRACRDPHRRGRRRQDTVGARGWSGDAGERVRRSVVRSARYG